VIFAQCIERKERGKSRVLRDQRGFVQGCDTVFVTPTGRTVDLVTAWIMVHFQHSFIEMQTLSQKLINQKK
jgi:hypothetical protein